MGYHLPKAVHLIVIKCCPLLSEIPSAEQSIQFQSHKQKDEFSYISHVQ